jgi:uncharacterized protein (TIGR02270 family)
MATSLRAFQIELYEEHLEEASFLYEQCEALRQRPDQPWRRLADFEDRLEAHVDALMVGGELALEVCRRRAVEGDPGELFASACVFCRYGEAPMLAAVLKTLDYTNAQRTQAAATALKHELPDAWRDACVDAIAQGEGALVTMLSGVVGYRRLRAGVLGDALGRASDAAPQRTLLWAIGRTRPDGVADAVRPLLRSGDRAVRDAALRALIRLHDPFIQRHLQALAPGADCPYVDIALAGGRALSPKLLAGVRPPAASIETVIAAGLMGDVSIARALVALLAVEPLAHAAAEALFVITGAPLWGDVLVPDEITEDEMFASELETYRKTGEVPTRGDGEPYGTRVLQISMDPSVWDEWLSANASRFNAQLRYRLGRPCEPLVLLQCLTSDFYPKKWRALAAEELLVRYGIDLSWEPDMPVGQQMEILRAAAPQAASVGERLEAGRWYFNGQAV